MDDYNNFGDDGSYSAYDDQQTSTDDLYSATGDDELDEEVLGDFDFPEGDLNGLHIVDENGEDLPESNPKALSNKSNE